MIYDASLYLYNLIFLITINEFLFLQSELVPRGVKAEGKVRVSAKNPEVMLTISTVYL